MGYLINVSVKKQMCKGYHKLHLFSLCLFVNSLFKRYEKIISCHISITDVFTLEEVLFVVYPKYSLE